MFIYMYIYVHIHIYICVCVYIYVHVHTDEASVPTQRRFTLVRARFATVRASLHPRTSESPGTFKYTKRLHIK